MAAVARLDLRCLMSACVRLARHGGCIIKQVQREGQLGAHNKTAEGDGRAAHTLDPAEVLTVADTRAQAAIVAGLRTQFPGIRLVGEEDESTCDVQEGDSPELPPHLGEIEEFEVPADLAQSLTYADTCLWIDPLDGTIEFVRNNLHHVCVLIGIAVCDRPVAGVIVEPFNGGAHGTVTYGAVGVGVFGDRSPAFGDPPEAEEEVTIGMEAKHAEDARLRAAVESVGRLHVSQGAGQNLLKVLRGQTAAFVQNPGASRWDSCAGEALLMAVGGKVTDLMGQPYLYTQGNPSYLNAEGLIAARMNGIHERLAWAVAGHMDAESNQEPEQKRQRIAETAEPSTGN